MRELNKRPDSDRVVNPGHLYELDNFEVGGNPSQIIHFIEKQPDPCNPTTFLTIYNGTTNEEVLKVLIHRLNNMNSKFPCRENSIVVTHLETALLWLGKRTADRKARGVEGRPLK